MAAIASSSAGAAGTATDSSRFDNGFELIDMPAAETPLQHPPVRESSQPIKTPMSNRNAHTKTKEMQSIRGPHNYVNSKGNYVGMGREPIKFGGRRSKKQKYKSRKQTKKPHCKRTHKSRQQ